MDSFLAASIFFVVLLYGQVHCEDSSPGVDDPVQMIESGKRQHNIMRFGKRPAGGHSLIHFGKREEEESLPVKTKAQHSFLYFGKREGGLLDYLQRNREASFKRGHNIMRFGKRAPGLQDSHNFIRFGRAPEGHNMLYFGKRGGTNGHSMLYFGKRGNNGHSMMYFGKRGEEEEDGVLPTYEDLDDLEKRAHAMIHFGKRAEEDGDDKGEKRAHSMIHFGKREQGEAETGGSYWDSDEKRQHNLLRFGKKMDRKGSHAMIHFGKRTQSDEPQERKKREVVEPQPPVDLVPFEEAKNEQPAWYPPAEVWNPLYYEEDDIPDFSHPDKKQSSKNVFLRFG